LNYLQKRGLLAALKQENSMEIEIIEFTENLMDYFKKLNVEWLEKFFLVLPSDEHVLTTPKESIIDKGGYIYFAKSDSEIIGTFALIKVDDKTYEIAKMAVTEKYQHQGIGKKLMDFAIQKAKGLNAELVILYSNTDLKIAVNMYAKYGFQVIPKTDFHNERANIKMEMKLK
jgi:N-acetylglutamate synthase-like GNAT family acetyltransferase